MATYSDVTTAISAGTAEVSGTIAIPGGTRIKQLMIINATGTAAVYYVRVEFAGMKTPQKYMVPNQEALSGTEAGGGVVAVNPIEVDIPIPSNISEVTFHVICTAASQTVYVGAKWVGP